MEIERKYLLEELPDGLDLGPGKPIEQGYIFSDPVELRLRRRGEQFFLTVKSSGTDVRQEWESIVPEWVWQALWPRTGDRTVLKTRHTIAHGEHLFELDIYHGNLDGLITLECEFAGREDARVFSLPSVFAGAIEVTDDSRYKNKMLAANGIPARGAKPAR